MTHRCQLYLISPPYFALPAFVGQLEAALEAGKDDLIGAFQLRLKDAEEDAIIAATQALMPRCHAHGVAFILNDRPDLAAKLGTDGVHLGQEDLETMPIAKARAIVGASAVIGVSCHASRHLAMEAGEESADYVAFGAFYPTASKPPEKQARWGTPTPDLLTWWQTYATLPSVAIGGITPENAGTLAASGADFVAAITSVWGHPKGPAAAVEAFAHSLREAGTIMKTTVVAP